MVLNLTTPCNKRQGKHSDILKRFQSSLFSSYWNDKCRIQTKVQLNSTPHRLWSRDSAVSTLNVGFCNTTIRGYVIQKWQRKILWKDKARFYKPRNVNVFLIWPFTFHAFNITDLGSVNPINTQSVLVENLTKSITLI